MHDSPDPEIRGARIAEARQIGPNDAQRYAALVNTIVAETGFLARTPADGLLTAQAVMRSAFSDGGLDTVFICETDTGMPVGYLCATRGAYQRLRAAIRISMGVLRSHMGSGVGLALLAACESWAAGADIRRIELIVMTSNAPAIALYRRAGYEIEGTRRASIRIDGVDHDQFLMAKVL